MSVKENIKKSNMSREDLEEIARFVGEELSKLEAEKSKLKMFKKDYHIEEFQYNWKINWYMFYEKVCASVAAGVPVDANVLEEIKNKSSEAEPLDYSKIYRCPKCGKLDVLYPGMFGSDGEIRVYAIGCSNCHFNLADTLRSSHWAAWEDFHEWLIKNGYLEKGTKQPEMRPRKRM